MALYSYRAINDQGKTSKGIQDAANIVDLELRLKRGGLDLVDAKEDSGKISFRRSRIKRPELITFFSTSNSSRAPVCRCWRASPTCAIP